MSVWAQFQKLSYKKEVRIGEVLDHLTGDMSKLEDTYGQIFVAVGTSVTIGNKAYVEDGVVVGEAPSLAEYEEFV